MVSLHQGNNVIEDKRKDMADTHGHTPPVSLLLCEIVAVHDIV